MPANEGASCNGVVPHMNGNGVSMGRRRSAESPGDGSASLDTLTPEQMRAIELAFANDCMTGVNDVTQRLLGDDRIIQLSLRNDVSKQVLVWRERGCTLQSLHEAARGNPAAQAEIERIIASLPQNRERRLLERRIAAVSDIMPQVCAKIHLTENSSNERNVIIVGASREKDVIKKIFQDLMQYGVKPYLPYVPLSDKGGRQVQLYCWDRAGGSDINLQKLLDGDSYTVKRFLKSSFQTGNFVIYFSRSMEPYLNCQNAVFTDGTCTKYILNGLRKRVKRPNPPNVIVIKEADDRNILPPWLNQLADNGKNVISLPVVQV